VIETYVLVRQGHKIARLARSGNQSATKWVLILVTLWFAGEIFGFFCGAIIGGIVAGDGLSLLLAYALGLMGALAGHGTAFKSLRMRIAADQRPETADALAFADDPPPAFND